MNKRPVKRSFSKEAVTYISRDELLRLIFGEEFDENAKNDIRLEIHGGQSMQITNDFRLTLIQVTRTEEGQDAPSRNKPSAEEVKFNEIPRG